MTAAARNLDGDDLAELTGAYRRARDASQASPVHVAEFCDPRYVRRPHVDLIGEEMRRLHTGDTERLLLRVPPQTGKTTTAAVWGAFWWLGLHPDHRVIIGSYNSNLAVNRGRQVRKLVHTHGWRYGLAVEWGAGIVSDWFLESGGGVKSSGVGGGITGSPSDLGIVDDPHKNRAEAESRARRKAVWDWYSADFLSRQAPRAPIVLIMTPWHEDDLSHRVLEQDGREEEGGLWRVVDMPAFARANDPLGRAPGAPLTHPKIPVHDIAAQRAFWEARRASSSDRDWVSLYLLEPKPVTNALVTRELIRERTHTPPPANPKRAAVGVDPSGGGRDVAGVVGGFLGDDRRAYFTHDRSEVGPSEVWGRAAALLAADLDADLITVEPNYGRDMAAFVVKKSWDALRREFPDDPRFQRLPPRVELATWAKKNKQLRADPIAQQIKDDRLRFGAYLPELSSEWWTWRPTDTESPGRIDASVYLAIALLPIDDEPATAAVPPTTRVAPRPAVPLTGRPGGGGVTPSLGDLQRRGRPPGRPGSG